MRLLRIGATTLNMERVNHIDDNDDQIVITFDNSVEHPNGSLTINSKHEVEALRRWLVLNSDDVGEVAEGSTGAPLGPSRTYVSTR